MALPTTTSSILLSIAYYPSHMLEPTRLTALRRASRAAGCARARTRHLRHMYINHAGSESRPLPADSNVIGLPPPPVFRPSSYSGTEQEPVQFDVRQGEPSSRVSASPTASEPLESIPDPFANVSADPEPDPSEMAVARVTLRAPWNTAVNRRQHPFDSHKFVSALEKASLDSNTSKALMEGVRGLMVSRKDQAMGKMLVREEADNVGSCTCAWLTAGSICVQGRAVQAPHRGQCA